ncbi:MAG: hypothetical protein EBU90_28855 [Proteobacteria bacterium]|nr:hypothetical protein [Pseudomonadota bacterium]
MFESLISSNDLKSSVSKLFISEYIAKFNKQLCNLSDTSKHLIRNNKELNEMYDLFLDFIIDGGQHLDYQAAKESEKNID